MLDNFKIACDSTSVQEGAAIWLFTHFIKERPKAALSGRVTAEKQKHQQEIKLVTYCQAVSFLLKTYATEDVIDEAETDVTSFKPPAGMTAVRYSEALTEETLRCGMLYNKPKLSRIFIEGLRSSICYSIRTYWGSHKEATLHSLARHTTSLVKLQKGSHSSGSSMR